MHAFGTGYPRCDVETDRHFEDLVSILPEHGISTSKMRRNANAWPDSSHDSLPSAARQSRTIVVYEHNWEPFIIESRPPSQETLPGEYEWPFEHFISGATVETARGCSWCSLTYELKAESIRATRSTWPHAYKPIRINRAPPPTAFDLMDASTIEGTWPGNIEYRISLAHQGVALGTAIPLDIHLQTPNAALRIERATCHLVEAHDLMDKMDLQTPPFKGYRDVCSWPLPLIEDRSLPELPREKVSTYRLSKGLPLPSSVTKCSPDVETHGIKVHHSLRIEVIVRGHDVPDTQVSWIVRWHPRFRERRLTRK